MFSKYSLILSISENISNLDINKYNEINYMFNECLLLKTLPDNSKWNVDNVNNMNSMFRYCKSL